MGNDFITLQYLLHLKFASQLRRKLFYLTFERRCLQGESPLPPWCLPVCHLASPLLTQRLLCNVAIVFLHLTPRHQTLSFLCLPLYSTAIMEPNVSSSPDGSPLLAEIRQRGRVLALLRPSPVLALPPSQPSPDVIGSSAAVSPPPPSVLPSSPSSSSSPPVAALAVVSLDSILSELMCPVCYEPCVPALTTPCGHTLCERCLVSWCRVSKSCPTCRKALNGGSGGGAGVVKNRVVDALCALFGFQPLPAVGEWFQSAIGGRGGGISGGGGRGGGGGGSGGGNNAPPAARHLLLRSIVAGRRYDDEVQQVVDVLIQAPSEAMLARPSMLQQVRDRRDDHDDFDDDNNDGDALQAPGFAVLDRSSMLQEVRDRARQIARINGGYRFGAAAEFDAEFDDAAPPPPERRRAAFEFGGAPRPPPPPPPLPPRPRAVLSLPDAIRAAVERRRHQQGDVGRRQVVGAGAGARPPPDAVLRERGRSSDSSSAAQQQQLYPPFFAGALERPRDGQVGDADSRRSWSR